jgi:thiamine-monophosphate kinase
VKEPLSEFGMIRQIQLETSVLSQGVKLGIGDDAAVLELPAGQLLVAATDTLNAGVHFPENTSAYDIGYKCLAVNLSDLAAMGASPCWALLSLTLPFDDADWLKSFTAGFKSLAEPFGVSLVGGDTTSGPLAVSVTALGVIEPGQQMLRSGAHIGDLLIVSGTVGGAARILELMQSAKLPSEPYLRARHLLDRPVPRVGLGQALCGYASACIDISDGLLADLNHILKASGCAALINTELLPAPALLDALEDEQRWSYQLAGGDDYELLFTLPRCHESMLSEWCRDFEIDLTIIGAIVEGEGSQCLSPGGQVFLPRRQGFEHFGKS